MKTEMSNRPTYRDIIEKLELKVSEAAQNVTIEAGPKNAPLVRSSKVGMRK